MPETCKKVIWTLKEIKAIDFRCNVKNYLRIQYADAKETSLCHVKVAPFSNHWWDVLILQPPLHMRRVGKCSLQHTKSLCFRHTANSILTLYLPEPAGKADSYCSLSLLSATTALSIFKQQLRKWMLTHECMLKHQAASIIFLPVVPYFKWCVLCVALLLPAAYP